MYQIYQLIVEQGWDRARQLYRFDTHKTLFELATSVPSWRGVIQMQQIAVRVEKHEFETEDDYNTAFAMIQEMEDMFGNVNALGAVVEWFEYSQIAPTTARDIEDEKYYIFNHQGTVVGVIDPDDEAEEASSGSEFEFGELDEDEKEAEATGETLLDDEEISDDSSDDDEDSDLNDFIVNDSEDEDGDEDYEDDDDDEL